LEDGVKLARNYAAGGERASKAAARAARETGLKKGEIYDRLAED
jgi:hypothetical protein